MTAASTCPVCGNDPEVFMHEKNCSLADIPQDEEALTVEQRLERLETWVKDSARWSDAIVERLDTSTPTERRVG